MSRPRLRLVCFAHAGGGSSAFRSWHHGLPADVEVVAVRYPGRQDRVTEPCIERMEVLVEAVTQALEPLLDRPLGMFGHSMGAYVAYETAHAVRHRYGVEPRLLAVSGQVPPAGRVARSATTDEEVLAVVRRLGGYDDSLFEDPELLDLVLPPIRSDFALLRGYRPAPRPSLTCPVVACCGERDVDVPVDRAGEWQHLTTGPFRQKVFPGGHFYLLEREQELLHELTEWLERWCGPGDNQVKTGMDSVAR